MKIDYKIVNEYLTCPICGEKAFIEPGTDGTEASHTHRFSVSREYAEKLTLKYGKPSYEDLERRVKELETQLEAVKIRPWFD